MTTVRLVVGYDGTEFSGFQRQRGVPTVQESIEIAIATMTGVRATVRGAGRTDAGVHAVRQLAAFQTVAKIPDKGWRLGLNSKLPPSIVVADARTVQDDFDPRRASAGKRYRYQLLLSPVRDPLLRNRVWHLWGDINLDAMQREAAVLVGTHDFAAFRAADCERTTTTRTIFEVKLTRDFDGHRGLVTIDVTGTAFLKNMVRVIVGTLVDVGRGRLAEGTVRARLTDRDRTRAGITAPAQGLILDEVFLKPEWRVADDPVGTNPFFSAPPNTALDQDR